MASPPCLARRASMAEQCFERALSAAEMAQLRGTDEIGSSKDLLGRASANHDGTFKHDGQLKVKPWEARGDFDEAHPGAAYWDVGDALQFPAAQHVGVAYQIASFGPIDTASESFNILLEVTTLHAIEEVDVPAYKEAQGSTMNACSFDICQSQAMTFEKLVQCCR